MMIEQRVRRSLAIAVLAGAATFAGNSAFADVKLPAVLSSHMVLQQGMRIPVWGTAGAGEEVTVTFGADKASTKADDQGNWEVKLAALKANDKPEDLVVSGKNKVELTDILVGEVWVCSGQSNMSFGMGNVKNHEKEIAEANFPEIRLFTVPQSVKTEPQHDTKGEWQPCTPKSAANFSAVAYFFGRDLNKNLKIPVGLIHTSWGGTPAEAWTAHQYMEQDSDLRPIIEHWETRVKGYATEEARWKENESATMKKWEMASEKAKADNKPLPRKPAGPRAPESDPNGPAQLYNGMITPIVPYAVRGAIWYQGESNAGRAYQYRKLLPAMIKSWRDIWHEPEMDFYIVSLANFQAAPKEPGDSTWAELREAQTMTAAMPHDGQAMAIDLADPENPGDIHPKNKQDVGYRLALVARAKTYGEKVEFSGPEYQSYKIEGNKIAITFTHHDTLEARGGEPLKGFQIAGEDKKWHWADARIEGHTVIVSSNEVTKPVAVRYDWANNPQGNLYNNANLPAVPFRTDDWTGITAGKN